MNLADILDNDLLPRVEKASRYLGTEWNSVHKDPGRVDLRIALVFADLYEMALGNLGLLILYHVLNRLPWCWCERAYAPAPDMERLLRERRLPLFAHESKDALNELDLLGFTLQSELTYTSIVNCLDLAGLPIRAADRSDDHPLVSAGGPGAFNPEPLAPFLDFFVLGDGEEAVVEIAERLRDVRRRPRLERLRAVADIAGVYIPAFYPVEKTEDGRELPSRSAPKIQKRLVSDLDAAPFPTAYLIPFTQQVHDRVGLEVLRGCTHGCRFCQAGMITRPVRERSLERLDAMFEEMLAHTGHEEISLVSLSTCDYSRARALVLQSARRARMRRTSLSLPSLRLDASAIDLAGLTADVRRTGLTVAPEAATPRLRAIINKWIPDDELLDLCAEAFRRGWTHIKTYFMIGLPGERDEDVEAIIDLCVRAIEIGRRIHPRARIHTGVSTFVPKPFTPFQWAEQISMEEAVRRQDLLRKGFARRPGIKFGRHSPESTYIEGLISRADRRAADLIEEAWRRGARLDSWDEHLNFAAWQDAMKTTGFRAEDAFRRRDPDERLPWDHIDALVSKAWLKAEWQRAQEGEYHADCRRAGCRSCGVSTPDRALCADILKRAFEGAVDEMSGTTEPLPAYQEPPAVQRIRFRIGRSGPARFLSHLESASAWIRALRRAEAPLAYSQGYHAHPKVTFSTAPPVGEESEADYMDAVLTERRPPEALLSRLQSVLPTGLSVYHAEEVPLDSPSLMSLVAGFSYDIYANDEAGALDDRITGLLAHPEVNVVRESRSSRRKPVTVNVRPMIKTLRIERRDRPSVRIRLETQFVEQRTLRPRELCSLLGLDPSRVRTVKRATRFVSDALETDR